MERLSRAFFSRHPKIVAPFLLGKFLVINSKEGKIITKIVETEAYGGRYDLGCHVGRFGYTKRTALLFGKVGCAYIYPVHINTFCLNVVCHTKKDAGGILLRALEPLKGREIILKNLRKRGRGFDVRKLLNGPGKICRALKIDSSLNGYDLIRGRKVYLAEGEKVAKDKIIATSRINIPYAGISKNWLWRFIIKDSEFLSRR
ncbi:MAG: DNA-3-methyladenine glycosylase [Candidatus Omnitrophica bacterium]|nr:DNA-3-methyladenine glycosylase [Candidatus Omnitrophota bacterium]